MSPAPDEKTEKIALGVTDQHTFDANDRRQLIWFDAMLKQHELGAALQIAFLVGDAPENPGDIRVILIVQQVDLDRISGEDPAVR